MTKTHPAFILLAALIWQVPAAGASPAETRRPCDHGRACALVVLDAKSGRFERAIDAEAAFGYTEPAIVSIVPDGRGGWFADGDATRLIHLRRDRSVDRAWTSRVPFGDAPIFSGGRLNGLDRGVGSAIGVGNISAADATTGALLWTWPDVVNGAVLAPIRAIAVSSTAVYAAVENEGLFAFDPVTGHPFAWHASSPILKTGVQALAASGGRVYAGGTFGVVAVRTQDAGLESWAPRYRSGDVRAIAVAGGTVFVGGKSDFAAFDAVTGKRRPWDEKYAGRVAVRWLTTSGGTVYVEGDLDKVEQVQCRDLFAVDAATGRVTSWPPDVATCVIGGALGVSGHRALVSGRFARSLRR